MAPMAKIPRMTYEAMAGRVRARRLACGLTQEQLAARAGVTVATLGRLELGKLQEPKLPTLDALAGALGITTGWLVSGGADDLGAGDEVVTRMRATQIGQTATAEELAHLRWIAARPPYSRAVSVAYLQTILVAMRGLLSPQEVEEVARLNENLDKKSVP